MTGRSFFAAWISIAVCWFLSSGLADGATPEETANEILAQAGLKGGLIVQIGVGDGALTAALKASDSY